MDVNRQTNASVALNARLTIVDAKQTDTSGKLDDALLRWLDGLSCVAKQEETLLLRQPDTCTWLLSTPEYQSWRNGDHKLLWLYGKPGSGKTVLASFVVDSLTEERGHGEALAYYYCDFRRDRSTSAAEVMRSILSQFLCHIRHTNAVPRGLVDSVIHDKDGNAPILNDVRHLAAFISQTATQFTDQPLVVVDALDECKDTEMLLDGFLALAQGGVQLFVTSRPLQVIKDGLRSFPSISMDNMMQQLSADIALHVKRELDSRRRLRDLEPSFKMETHAVLCARADGMFRWVQCQLDALDRCATKAEVRDALNDMPVGLNAMYQRSLVAIDVDSPEGELALRVLAWLIAALRPLRSREILEGLSIDPERRTADRNAGPIHKGALLDACGSLVTYNEKTDVLLLSHSSVKEYLTGNLTRIKLPQYHISYQDAHGQLARVCIRYLGLYLKHVQESSGNIALSHIAERRSQASDFPGSTPALFFTSQELIGYVFSHGLNHLAYLGSANHVVLQDLMALGLDIQQYPDAWKAICKMSGIPWVSEKHDFMFHILTAFSSSSLFLTFLRRHHPLLQPKPRTNPLLYAVHLNKFQHAEILLLHGANIDEPGWAVDAPRLASPLEIAIGRRKEAMVYLFLSAGGTVPKRLFALSTYYRNYPFRLVRMLLETNDFAEWAREPGNELPSPLRILEQQPSLELEMDIIRIIRRLVQVGVDLAERDSSGKTVLDFAVLGGYKAIALYLLQISRPRTSDFISTISKIRPPEQIPMLRLIIEAGFDVDRDIPGNDTALHLAVTSSLNDCLEVVKILVDAGCDPFARGADGKTPLHLALKKGDASVAGYLLSQGTPPSDILIAVVESRCPTRWRLDTVRALVHGGAYIGGITWHASLDDAAIDPSLLADYLLEAGPPPLPEVLFAVLRSGLPTPWKTLIVCSLVGKGTDVRARSSDGKTLLHVALRTLDERAGLEVAQYLVGAGCDPFESNACGSTPLYIALDRSFTMIADFFLSTGDAFPPYALHVILSSPLPADRKVRTIRALAGRGDVHELSASGSPLLHTVVLTLDEPEALDVAQFLVHAGCQLSARDAEGKTALQIASAKGYISIVEYILLLDKSLPDEILYSVLESPSDKRVRMLNIFIEEGSNVYVTARDGSNLLHAAIRSFSYNFPLARLVPVYGRESACHEFVMMQTVVETLVEHGCDAFASDCQDQTPLHLAVAGGYVPIVKYLLSIPARPSLPPDILLYAPDWKATRTAWKDTSTALRLLVGNGADVGVRDVDGRTLLHMIFNYPRSLSLRHPSWTTILELRDDRDFGWPSSRDGDLLQIVKVLVEAGCESSLCDADNRPPIYVAMTQGHVDVVEYLLPINLHPLEDLEGAIDLAPSGVRSRLRELLESQQFEQLALWEACAASYEVGL